MTNEELKSETNRVMSWVIWSARNNIKDVSSDKYRLLSLMFCQEKDVDEEYVKKRYDLTMLLRNIGGNGGMRLVSDEYFDWGVTAMRIVSKELTVADELFKIRDYARVTNEELKSETNRVMSWAMWSAREKIKDASSDKYRLLSLMFCQEKDVDEGYVKARYDLTMLLRNIGGNGGMRLVSGEYFDWGVTVMRIVSKELTVADIEMKGSKAFGRAKQAMFNHTSLKSDFALICQRQSRRDQRIETSYELSSEIYNEVLDKVCNSRFNEVMDNYAEQRALKGKGKLGLRPTLLAGVSAKKEGTAGATITASPSPTFDVLLLGENGAVGTKLLNGSFFVLTGLFTK